MLIAIAPKANPMNRTGAPQALAGYEYRTHSDAILYPLLKRYVYQPLVLRLPMSVHANVLTLVATAFCTLAILGCLVVLQNPQLSPLLVGSAVALLLYQTFDNIDGPQARRTGTSGPLGELLDHGQDSLVVFLLPLGLGALFELPVALYLGVVTLSALGFWASMWEQHHTGVLVTGRLSDVEGLIIFAAVLVAAGVLGVETFTVPLFEGFPSLSVAVLGVAVFGFGVQVLGCHWRTPSWKARVQVLGVLAPLIPLAAWVAYGSGQVPLLGIAALIGLCIARSTVRVISSRLYGTPFRSLDPVALTVCLVLPAASLTPGGSGHEALLCWSGVVVLASLHLTNLFREARFIARTLGVHLFRHNHDEGEATSVAGSLW